MAWYWWIVLWVVLEVIAYLFIAGAHDDSRFDERPKTHPPNKDGNKNENKWW